jgi:hypothetical protein
VWSVGSGGVCSVYKETHSAHNTNNPTTWRRTSSVRHCGDGVLRASACRRTYSRVAVRVRSRLDRAENDSDRSGSCLAGAMRRSALPCLAVRHDAPGEAALSRAHRGVQHVLRDSDPLHMLWRRPWNSVALAAAEKERRHPPTTSGSSSRSATRHGRTSSTSCEPKTANAGGSRGFRSIVPRSREYSEVTSAWRAARDSDRARQLDQAMVPADTSSTDGQHQPADRRIRNARDWHRRPSTHRSSHSMRTSTDSAQHASQQPRTI